MELRLTKLGTPELGKFFPELPSVIARSTRQRRLCRRPLSGKRPHFVFFAFHVIYTYIYTHIYIYMYIYICIYIYMYIYMTVSHATIDNTYISHPQVHTHHKSIETSPQVHKVSQIQRNKFTTWSTKSKGLWWVLVRWERWDGRREDLLTTWSLVIRNSQERLHKGDKIASVRHD
jgi:hypothetical protein